MTRSQEPELKPPLKLALVGCGWFARAAHLPALKRLERAGAIEISALCSLSPGSLELANQIVGRPLPSFSSLDELVSSSDVDVLDLTVPIPVMDGAIRTCLSAGKHVISEKPCAGSLEQARKLVDYYESLSAPPIWAVAENWRFKPTVMLLQRMISNRTIGDLSFADFRHVVKGGTDNLGWRNTNSYSGGQLLDSGVHFVAMLRKVVGDVARVTATTSRREIQFAGVDSVAACLEYADGTDGLFRFSVARSDSADRSGAIFVGSSGSISVDFQRATLKVALERQTKTLKLENDPWVQGGVFELLEHCIQAIVAGQPVKASPSEALADMATIEAMILSSKAGKSVRPVALTATILHSPTVIRTYQGLRDFRPRILARCDSVDEVRAAVAAANDTKSTIRVIGHGLSWAHHVATSDTSIAIGGLNRITAIHAGRGLVDVEAGCRLGHLTADLASRGLAIPSLPFLNDQTVGGAVATATHGSSLRWGTLSDFVEAITLVLASGDVIRVDASDETFLRAARVSVGMLGVIVAVTLRVIPNPTVRVRRFRLTLDRFVETRRKILEENDHVWVKWTLGSDRVEVSCLQACDSTGFEAQSYVIGDNAAWQGRQRRPALIDRASRKVNGLQARIRFRFQSQDSIASPSSLCSTSMQYGVPLSDFDTTLAAITASDFPDRHAGRDLEFKFLAGSRRSMLGPNTDGDAALFNIWWQVERDAADHVFDAFEELMLARKAKPHWGKHHRPPDPLYMSQAFPDWPAFEAVRARLDPDRRFTIFPEERQTSSYDPVPA